MGEKLTPVTPARIRPFEDRDDQATVAVGNPCTRYVAESSLFRSSELPDVLCQGIIGTRRAYRGRGIALALRLRTIGSARSHGKREIRAWNDTPNAAMLAINTALGFVRQPAWITYEKSP